MIQQKDIALIVGALVVAVLAAFVAGKYIFSTSEDNTVVDVVPTINTTFSKPAAQYFNYQSIDPTQLINIRPNNSQQPFSGQ